MINAVVLVGRLTRDPELKYTQSGLAYLRFILAVNRRTKNGEQEADFITCVAWRKQAENMANYLSKGSLVGIEGRVQTGSYEKDGQRIYTTDIVVNNVQFLESRRESANVAPAQSNYQPTPHAFPAPSSITTSDSPSYAPPTYQAPHAFPTTTESSVSFEVVDDDLPF